MLSRRVKHLELLTNDSLVVQTPEFIYGVNQNPYENILSNRQHEASVLSERYQFITVNLVIQTPPIYIWGKSKSKIQRRCVALARQHTLQFPTVALLKKMNSILVIHPYKYQNMWVFDDEKVGLVQEPFVAGADKIIDQMVVNIPNAKAGFSLLFSAHAFPAYQTKFEWRREEYGGNWYYNADLDMEGWLCPALFKYFDQAPKEFYAQFKAKA